MADEDEARDDKADDYEYDEAHDAPEASRATSADPPPTLRPPAAMHVTDDGGDYGYDAAHDRC